MFSVFHQYLWFGHGISCLGLVLWDIVGRRSISLYTTLWHIQKKKLSPNRVVFGLYLCTEIFVCAKSGISVEPEN